MSWLSDLVVKHDLSKSLAKVTLLNLFILSLWFIPVSFRLLGIFFLASAMFLISVVLYTRILWEFKKLDVMPNYGTYGYWIIAVGGLIFSAVVVVPSLLSLSKLAEAPIGIFSYAFVFSYFYPVWTFYLVATRGYRIIRQATFGSSEKDDIYPADKDSQVGFGEEENNA